MSTRPQSDYIKICLVTLLKEYRYEYLNITNLPLINRKSTTVAAAAIALVESMHLS